ncbi:MAG: hypothetical protein FWE31_03375 [Firmicutes bacterium]|nr:hypothetical protein [Bacillota bacterium]
MTKVLRCPSCAANLSSDDNLQCNYCGAKIQITKINPVVDIIVEFEQLCKVMNAQQIKENYARAKIHIGKGRFEDADDALDAILAVDDTQTPAWYFKSLMPHFKHEKQLEFIDMAISNANEKQKDFLIQERKNRVKKERRKMLKRRLETTALVVGAILSLAAITLFSLWRWVW